MSNERLRTQTLQQISAYLDDALSPLEKQKLESRLTRESKLREQMEKLRRTKIILGHLPRLRAPRHFTLTPEMVKVRRSKRKSFYATLRLATALSAVLLVVLGGVQLFLGNNILPVFLQEQAPMLESARADEEAEPQPLIQWGASGVGGAGEEGSPAGMGGGAEEMEAPMEAIEAVQPEEPAEAEEALPEMDAEEIPAEPPEMAPESDMAPPTEDEEPATQEQSVEEKNIILGVNPEEGGEIIDRSEPAEPPLSGLLSRLNLIQTTMLALAVIVVIGSLALLLLRKRRQR